MSKETIFITGATGFIGCQVAATSLAAGYRVRLSVRKQEQIQRLKEILPNSADDVEFVVIPDITKTQSFDSALDGVAYVFHIASPMPGKADDLHTGYIEPAVQGTTAVLDAALTKPGIRKVIVMASIMALATLTLFMDGIPALVQANTGERVLFDIDFPVPEGGTRAGTDYQISKILAHQASRDWLAANKPHFVLATAHPTFVIGPSLIQRTAQELDGINAWFFGSLVSETPIYPCVTVDVRDVADAFVKTLTADVTSGTEFIMSGPPSTWTEVVEFVKKTYPNQDVKVTNLDRSSFAVDKSKTDQVLGIKWRDSHETIRDLIDQQNSFTQS